MHLEPLSFVARAHRLARRREAALTCVTALWCLQGVELAWRLAPGQLAVHAERSIVLPLERMALVERLAMASLFSRCARLGTVSQTRCELC